jgi:SRSO17 transposase
VEKTFDCLKMKEEIQAKIYEEIKDMSAAEEIAYFNKKAQNNALWQRLVKRDKAKKQTAF